jgi:hypothetical protein
VASRRRGLLLTPCRPRCAVSRQEHGQNSQQSASLVVSGAFTLLAGFFALWTHGAVPYDPLLAVTLLIGTGVIPRRSLALGRANYSNRGDLRVCGRSGFRQPFSWRCRSYSSTHRNAGRGDRDRCQRSADSIWAARRHHYEANASATISPRPFSGCGNDPRDVGRLAAGHDHPVVGAGDGTDAICLRVHALADDSRSSCRPDAESMLPQEGSRGNPALIFMTANRLGE